MLFHVSHKKVEGQIYPCFIYKIKKLKRTIAKFNSLSPWVHDNHRATIHSYWWEGVGRLSWKRQLDCLVANGTGASSSGEQWRDWYLEVPQLLPHVKEWDRPGSKPASHLPQLPRSQPVPCSLMADARDFGNRILPTHLWSKQWDFIPINIYLRPCVCRNCLLYGRSECGAHAPVVGDRKANKM